MLRNSLITLAVIVVPLVLLLWVVPVTTRSSHMRWGASDKEVAAKLAGDAIVPHPKSVATRAVTIDAPPAAVWPWIVQVGMKRAGWYTYDWFYDATGSSGFVDGHSADRIVPELQDVKVGDTVSINKAISYVVAVSDKPRAFILLAGDSAKTGKPFKPGAEPKEYMNTTLGWVLEPLPGNRTRLIARILTDGRGTGYDISSAPPLEFGGFVMARANLLGIKERAEKAWRAGKGASPAQ